MAAMPNTNPAIAWKALKQGNERFVAGTPEHPSQSIERRSALAKGQKPTAVLFGCADSRVAAEIIFDQGLGDMFVVRTAGHVIDSAVLGSIEYAVTVLDVPLIVVLGHDSCGAVQAALSAIDDGVVPGGYVRDIVERVTPSILFGRSAGLTRLDEFEARHVTETVAQLRVRSTTIAQRHRRGWPCRRRRDLSPGRRSGGACAIIWATSAKAEPPLSCSSRRRSSADTPSHLGRLCVTWPYREFVLDLEPHGPLPQQIYWRRRALALGIAVLVIGVIAAVVVMIVMNTGARRRRTPTSPPRAGRRADAASGGEPPGQDAGRTACGERTRPNAHADRCGRTAARAAGGRRLPGLRAGSQGHHQPAAVCGGRPAEVHHGRHEHRVGGLQA